MPKDFDYALKERIGNPDLFVGRKDELDFLNKWLANIPRELSKSTAILSRRKKGKTALVERFYNIIYNKNENVIPFYYEVREGNKWVVNFALDFYTNFLSQYLGFKLRNIELCREPRSLNKLEEIARKHEIEVIIRNIDMFKDYYQNKDDVDNIWEYVQSAPHRIASVTGDYIVQVIDEFQFLNSEIYWDQEKKNIADDLAGTYLSLAESKIAPLLVTGSWVGWLKNIIRRQLPIRFEEMELGNLTEEEGLEAVYNYSNFMDVAIKDDIALYLNNLVNSDPFYISAIIQSNYPEKDLTTEEGLLKLIEYELREGNIYNTWMEYILNTLDRVNDLHAKKIILFLSKNRDREWTRQEIIKKCDLPYDDREAEKKLRIMIKGDLISEGSTSVRYKGMSDDIFYQLFRYKYEEEIENFSLEKIREEVYKKQKKKIKSLEQKLKSFKGKEKYYRGKLLEYVLIKYLRTGEFKNKKLKNLVKNHQSKARFTDYREVKSYTFQTEGSSNQQIDIRAYSIEEDCDLYFEIKNWQQKVDSNTVEEFVRKVKMLGEMEYKGFYIFYALNGFTEQAEEILVENDIMYADWENWPIEIYN